MSTIYRYQLVFIGTPNPYWDGIKDVFFKHIGELGMSKDMVIVLDEKNFAIEYKANAPLYCLYFGDPSGNFKDADILIKLITDASLILPVTDDLKQFSATIPKELRIINGFELSSQQRIEPLVSVILEGLGLLRNTRRLFISYKRDESSKVAIQLFEQFEKNGFDVFLDTHSIRHGEPFQDELWHRLADTDIVVLLNTPGFLKSEWTKEELARANAMMIGVLQLIWPTHKQEREAEISIPIQLQAGDFGNSHFADSNSYLINETILRVVEQAESLRARSLAARQDNIVSEFISAANKTGVPVNLHPEKIITATKISGKNYVMIPTIGVPQALRYNQAEEVVKKFSSITSPEIYLLYDHINIRDKWLLHLDWLDKHLPIKTIKIFDAEQWLQRP
ncbi:MAG TPA: toll/interleukin-1 receptor domain-containing protein [Chitinophagaceae bacterium]|nr:toll/interleukin-1 receptor domain-containing protein [Chitinophagaceae bacterium]